MFKVNEDLEDKIKDCFLAAFAAAAIGGVFLDGVCNTAEANARRVNRHAAQVSQEALVWNHTERPLLLLHTIVRNSLK